MGAGIPAVVGQWTLGVLLVSWRYLWTTTVLHRSSTAGDARDGPPALPERLVDDRSQPLGRGVGALYHRVFTVDIAEARMSDAELIRVLADDLNRGVPTEVTSVQPVDAPSGRLRVGEELVVRMPGPYDGPVRLVHRDPTSFRFATLTGHMEAGQIEFRAAARGRSVRFEIEAWARPSTPLVNLLFSRLWLASEIQFNMWVRFCLNAASTAGGRPESGITIRTSVVRDQTQLETCIRNERGQLSQPPGPRAAVDGAELRETRTLDR